MEPIISKHGKHIRQRLYKGIKGRRPDNKAHKRTEAAERQQAYNLLTIEQKIAKLDEKQLVAKRQRERLNQQLLTQQEGK
jgi:hypothetical protein